MITPLHKPGQTFHEGLGTTYERFVLNAYFKRIRDRYGVNTVLEVPLFGMAGIFGINSLWWAREGAEVTLADHSPERLACIREIWRGLSLNARMVCVQWPYAPLPFGDNTFDMSWNFAALNQLIGAERLLLELARVTRKIIFICLPNPHHLLRPFLAFLHGGKWRANRYRISLRRVEDTLKRANWVVSESGYLDVPPWPDIAMPKEDLCRKIGLRRYANRLEKKRSHGSRLCILDYYAGHHEKMKGEIGRYGFLENGSNGLKCIWAHHRYRILTPRDPMP